MKRKRSEGRAKPRQAIPFGVKILNVVKNWELNKRVLLEIRKDAALLEDFRKNQAAGSFTVEAMDSMTAKARKAAGAWLLCPDEAVKTNGVLELWETFLAIGELGDCDQRARWLSQKTREEQLLIARISNCFLSN